MSNVTVDVFVIGGGVNGCGIARDASGRGLSVTLAEMGDLAQATSSASTKLFHGGLRYLEYFEIRLVREALRERETLLRAMPHISWPLRFVLPLSPDMRFESRTPTSRLLKVAMPWLKGRRPEWLIRFGLYLYDTLGGREILPGTATLDLTAAPEGRPLKDSFRRAFEYSDAWVEDSRLVVLNARDAAARGATILTRTRVVSAVRADGLWTVTTEDIETGARTRHRARRLVNAAGPWARQVLSGVVRSDSAETVRLVRGSHIVTRRLFEHDKCYFFQGSDGRILFAIPYEEDFTLIGTTDQEHGDPDTPPVCTEAETEYMLAFANRYLKAEVTRDDIVWTFSGVRPLYDDGRKSATAATRDYTLKIDDDGAPLLTVYGGKITTYRSLAEAAMDKLRTVSIGIRDKWTAGVPLPGGDFSVEGVHALTEEIAHAYPFTKGYWARRLVRAYGTEVPRVLGKARATEDLGTDFGATLTEREVVWLMEQEWARTAEDVVWRRSRLGLRMTPEQIAALDDWMAARRRPGQ